MVCNTIVYEINILVVRIGAAHVRRFFLRYEGKRLLHEATTSLHDKHLHVPVGFCLMCCAARVIILVVVNVNTKHLGVSVC